MRVLILGGAGKEGTTLAKHLSETSDVSEIILADRRQEAVNLAATSVGKKAKAIGLDITDTKALEELMKKVDIVANCVGPFYRFGATILKSAINTGKNYVDICDDPDATMELYKHDDAAKKAGITALICCGESPGLSNMVCKYAAEKLDRVDKMHVYWTVHLGSSGGGVGAGLHGWHMFTGLCPQFLDGKLVNVQAGSGAEMVDFPEETTECYFLGHPEQVTLPRYIRGVKEVFNKGTMLPVWAQQYQFKLMEMGFDSNEPVKIKTNTTIIPVEVGLAMHSRYLKGRDLGKPWAGFKCEIIGKKATNDVTYTYTFPLGSRFSESGMELATAIGSSVGLLMLGRGQTARVKGVVAPEGLLDAKAFLNNCLQTGLEPFVETVKSSGKMQI